MTPATVMERVPGCLLAAVVSRCAAVQPAWLYLPSPSALARVAAPAGTAPLPSWFLQ